MHSLDWGAIIATHPVFETLDEDARAAILDPAVATERRFSEGDAIVQQGTPGSSIFVIGRGAAAVMAEKPDGRQLKLCDLGRGELFGEMAPIEERARSATLVASVPTVVLEIRGEAFMALVRQSAPMAVVLLEKMSRRLRSTYNLMTDLRLTDHDETLAELRARIDTVVQSTEAKLAASEKMYDQTARRATEVIDSADRARNYFRWSLGIGAPVIGVLGALGFSDLSQTVNDAKTKVAEVEQISTDFTELQETLPDFAALNEQIAAMKLAVDEAEAQMAEIRDSTTEQVSRLEAEADTRMSEMAEVLAQAKQDVNATLMLEQVRAQSYTKRTRVLLSEQMNRFHPQVVKQLETTLTQQLHAGQSFHDRLSRVTKDNLISNPNGEVFINYFLALGALFDPKADEEQFEDYRTRLVEIISNESAALAPPAYIDKTTASFLKQAIKRQDGPEVQSRGPNIDDLVALMSRIKG